MSAAMKTSQDPSGTPAPIKDAPGTSAGASLRAQYCSDCRCTQDGFQKRMVHRCFYPHALPFFPIINIVTRRFFAEDINLIRAAGQSLNMEQIDEEIRCYFMTHPKHEGLRWFKRAARIRISTNRLRNLAKHYLPED